MEVRVPRQDAGAEPPVVVMKPSNAGGAKERQHPARNPEQLRRQDESGNRAKPFDIPKRLVWEAYERVQANRGAAGVDKESLADFDRKRNKNLYKLWNRLSSGSYFAPAVLKVEIPKKDGGKRVLGIPTVTDRIAQTVVKMALEPMVEPYFHPDSYGYRPGKSALDAVGQARERCWRSDWVVDLDIQGFFDTLDHALVKRALSHFTKPFTESRWIHLYVERWLIAPLEASDGTQTPRTTGTPQGGVISPLLANMFLHFTFDTWMDRVHPGVPFERYADDMVVHCKSERQSHEVLASIRERMKRCKLALHPQKTKIVYCKDSNRRGRNAHEKFDFLGYTFRPRKSKNRQGDYFVNFIPAVSDTALKRMRHELKRKRIHLWSSKSLQSVAEALGPTLRGWLGYYGKYGRGALSPLIRSLEQRLVRWAMRKFKKLRRRRGKASQWLNGVAKREPKLFAHWAWQQR